MAWPCAVIPVEPSSALHRFIAACNCTLDAVRKSSTGQGIRPPNKIASVQPLEADETEELRQKQWEYNSRQSTHERSKLQRRGPLGKSEEQQLLKAEGWSAMLALLLPVAGIWGKGAGAG